MVKNLQENEEPIRVRPTFLTVACVLSFINCAWILFNGLSNMGEGVEDHLKQNAFVIPLIIPINQMVHVNQNHVHMELSIQVEIVIVMKDLHKVLTKSHVWIYVRRQIKCIIKILKNVYNHHLVTLQRRQHMIRQEMLRVIVRKIVDHVE